jgi:hypothetical protein
MIISSQPWRVSARLHNDRLPVLISVCRNRDGTGDDQLRGSRSAARVAFPVISGSVRELDAYDVVRD